MRELVDKRLMLEDVKSWVAMDSYEQHLINNMSEWIENLPTVEVSDGDCISRRAAIDAIMGQPPEPHYPSWYAAQIEKLPAAQPDRDVIDDCLYHIYKNISVHTATGGVITIRYYMEKLYEEIYGKGERPWWMT